MQLKEIHIRNWRSYRNATFVLPSSNSHQNVILIGAQNGTGKTSLLMALYLGLFGREAMYLIEGIRLRRSNEDKNLTYKSLLEQILHRPAIRQDEPHCSVQVRFESSIGDSILIQRRWNFNHGGKICDINSADGEEVIAEIYGRRKVYRSWQDANAEIEELLFPVNVMGCFFFDGEQAQERVEAAGGRALLDAVNTLYGTGILDKLSESLKSFITNSRAQLRRDTGNVKIDELDQKRDELDQSKECLKQIELELTDKQKERDSIESEHNRLLQDLQQLVGDSAADIEEYARARGALETEALEIKQDLINGLSAIALPLAMTRYVEKVRSILKSEQIRDRWLLLKEEASGKASKIIENVFPEQEASDVIPPLNKSQIDQLRIKLENALEALWSPPPDGCAENYQFHFLREADRGAVISKLKRYQTIGGSTLIDSAIRLDNLTTRLREVQRRHDRVKEIEPQLAHLKKQVTETLDSMRKIGDQISGFEHRAKGMQEYIKNLKAAIGQMEKRRAIERPMQEKLDIAHRVRTTVDEAKDALIPLCKKSLEDRCTEHFRKMISDEYQNFDVKFDPETQPRLEGPGGTIVFVSSLSGAQKRAFGLAFTLAVADVSGQQAPIIIDTPVGTMDSKYRERVLRYVAQASPGQVIFLSHDEEISPFYRNKLKEKVLKTFLIKFEKVEEGSGMSILVEDNYFG